MVNIINPYIHEYDLDYVDFLNNNLNKLYELYDRGRWEKEKLKGQTKGITDVTIDSPLIINYITPKLDKIVTDNYYAGNKLRESGLRCYKQSSTDYISSLHTHVRIMHSVSAVFYLNIPKIGGEIYFNYLEGISNEGWGIKIKPLLNKVYLFPSWLPHTPLPHKDENVERLSFNWVYCSDVRARHKSTGTIW